jgi:hypothetical protein
MKVLIQGNEIPQTVDCSIAFHGFEELNADITIKQEWFSLDREELLEYDVCVGSVHLCQNALFKMGIKDYEIPCYPQKLERFFHRTIYQDTLGNVISKKFSVHKFIKPVKSKRFASFITDSKDYAIALMNLDENEPVYVSSLVSFESEWRVYIKDNDIQAVCFYKGDPTLFPEPKIIRRMIRSWDGPCCYGLDVGVFKNMTCLVEVNDFYSIGNYGLEPLIYANMLCLRWRELLNANSNVNCD